MKKIKLTGLFCFILMLACGCSIADDQTDELQSDYMYYLNAEESKIVQQAYEIENTRTEKQVEELCRMLSDTPEDMDLQALLPRNTRIEEWTIKDQVLWLDFNESYHEMSNSREILVRAGVVRIFCQLSDIKNVGIQVAGKELQDSRGEYIGLMNKDSFVEDSGKDINAYQYVKMSLYFTNKSGDELVKEERNIYYSKNTPLERAVIEQLVLGPKNNENAPIMPPEVKILGASAMDEIGYVNLDKTFQEMILPIKEDITIRAIVNSLADTCGIKKVQISINGESKARFRESISLDQLFEPDSSVTEEQE